MKWFRPNRRVALTIVGALLVIAGCSDDSEYTDVDREAIETVVVAGEPALADDDEALAAAVDAVAQLCEDLAGSNAAQIAYYEADDLAKDAARAGCPDRIAATIDS